MTDLTERLVALRDYLRNTVGGRPSQSDLDILADAANRLTDLEAENARLREALETHIAAASKCVRRVLTKGLRERDRDAICELERENVAARAALSDTKEGSVTLAVCLECGAVNANPHAWGDDPGWSKLCAGDRHGPTWECDFIPAPEPACTCKPTGECRVAMSGPTCGNPDCPPCQTPELDRDPDCPVCGTPEGTSEAPKSGVSEGADRSAPTVRGDREATPESSRPLADPVSEDERATATDPWQGTPEGTSEAPKSGPIHGLAGEESE